MQIPNIVMHVLACMLTLFCQQEKHPATTLALHEYILVHVLYELSNNHISEVS